MRLKAKAQKLRYLHDDFITRLRQKLKRSEGKKRLFWTGTWPERSVGDCRRMAAPAAGNLRVLEETTLDEPVSGILLMGFLLFSVCSFFS